MFRAGVILVAAMLLIAATPIQSTPVSDPRPKNSHPTNQEATGDNQEAGNRASAGAAVINEPTYYLQPAPKPENDEPFYKQWDFWVASATLALVAATLALAVPAWLGLNDARDAHQRELRAYVWLRGKAIHDMEVGRTPRVEIEIRNSGRTPAYNMNVRAGAIVYPFPLPPDTPFPPIGAGGSNSRIVLHPGAEPPFIAYALWSGTAPLDPVQRNHLVSGAAVRLFVFASIEYQDAFGEDRETKACFAVQMTPAQSAAGTTFSVAFNWADQHNTAT